MTAFLRDYLFTNHEITPKKVEIALYYVAFKGFRIRFIEKRTPEND